LAGTCAQTGLDLHQSCPVGDQPGLAQRGGIGHRIEGEIVDVAVELEPHHPIDEFRRRNVGGGGDLGMQFQKPPARVADDAAGVIGAGDDFDRAAQCFVGHRVRLGWISCRQRGLEDVQGDVHLVSVVVGYGPSVDIGPGTNQWQDPVGEPAHRRSPGTTVSRRRRRSYGEC